MPGTVRFGIIGCGGFARTHMKTLGGLAEASVTALFDPDPAQIEKSRSEQAAVSGATVHGSIGSLLADPDVDAVLVCSPHTGHAAQILASFSAGKHVLVEKPLTTSVADAHSVIQARDKSGLVGAVSYQRHGQGPFQFIRGLLESGQMGAVRVLNSHLAQQWLRFTKGTWRQELALSGGGQINDSGSHMIDILLWATGLRASRVSALMDNRETEVDIDSVVSIEFEGGAYGSLTIIGDACCWHERHQIWCEKGALILEGDQLTIIDEEGKQKTKTDWPEAVSPDANFVSAILRGEPVLAPFECGLRTIELTEAAWRSSEQGGAPVEVASL